MKVLGFDAEINNYNYLADYHSIQISSLLK